MIRDKDFKNKVAISPSRLETYQTCSALYAAKYLHKLPDAGNSGSKRGSVTHDTLEILHNPRHKTKIDRVLVEKTCQNIPSLWKLVVGYATKYGVNNEDDLNMIDNFIHTALITDFHGPAGTIETYSERDFDFEVESGPVNYRLKGFIDRTFVYRKGNNLYIKTIDWKTSKEIFKGDKIETNNQAICYQLAITRYLFPEIPMGQFEFIFLKFPKKPVLAISLMNEFALYGYELFLTNVQKELNEFSVENTADNYAAHSRATSWLCGREGLKKDGTPNFICGCRKPLKYWASVKDGKIISSSFTREGLKVGDGEVAEEKSYGGCSYYYKDGKKLTLSYE